MSYRPLSARLGGLTTTPVIGFVSDSTGTGVPITVVSSGAPSAISLAS